MSGEKREEVVSKVSACVQRGREVCRDVTMIIVQYDHDAVLCMYVLVCMNVQNSQIHNVYLKPLKPTEGINSHVSGAGE